MTEKLSVVLQLENLLTYPTVKEKIENGQLFLRGWYYKMDTGEIEYFNEEKKDFFPMVLPS